MKTLKNFELEQTEFFKLGLFKLFEKIQIIVYMNICSTHLKLKKMSNICEFDRILKTECNLQHFTRSGRIKNLDDFERDEEDACLWTEGPLNVRQKGMDICYIMNRCLVMFLTGGKVNVAQYWWNIITKLNVNKWSLFKWLSN